MLTLYDEGKVVFLFFVLNDFVEDIKECLGGGRIDGGIEPK